MPFMSETGKYVIIILTITDIISAPLPSLLTRPRKVNEKSGKNGPVIKKNVC